MYTNIILNRPPFYWITKANLSDCNTPLETSKIII